VEQQITIKDLLEAGVHFGHQTKRWNPKMKQYIFGERNGIHIIDLEKTHQKLLMAMDFLRKLAENGEGILFVGTKRQIRQIVEEEASRCGAFYITNRWPGGLLTNFKTIRQSIKLYKELQGIETDERAIRYTKKELSKFVREREKMGRTLSGIVSMSKLPSAVCVIDIKKESLAVKEANRLGIPVVAVVDTNVDPQIVQYPVPGNDDAIRSVKVLLSMFAGAIAEGRNTYEQTHPAGEHSEPKESAKDLETAGETEEQEEQKKQKRSFKKKIFSSGGKQKMTSPKIV
jgi:small subunit ribosomal protein S2